MNGRRLFVRRAVGAALLAASTLAIALVFACGSDSSAGPSSSADDGGDASSAGDALTSDSAQGRLPDATRVQCTLLDGTDPVGFCVQKRVLQSMHSVFTDAGIPVSWTTHAGAGIADTDEAGAIPHDLHDDIAYGAALGRYQTNAVDYGDDEIAAIVYSDLPRIAALAESELATLPDEYGGELYRNLRYLAVGLRYIDQNTEATKIEALADAYGKGIHDRFFHALTPVDAGGAADAGGDGAVDAGGDAGVKDDGILGVAAPGGGYAYDSVGATSGAFAMIDMALNHAPDATTSASWLRAGLAVIDHVWRRSRDPVSGMAYRSLVTSDAAGGDTPVDRALTADVQVTIALALLRTHELAPADAAAAPALAAYPLGQHATSALASVNGTGALSLWDDDAGGYMEALDSDGGVVTTKATRANALALAAIQRSYGVAPSPYAPQVSTLRRLLLGTSPDTTGLFAVVLDQAGYFRAATRDFKRLDPSAEPHAASYQSAATTAACEGLSELGAAVPGAVP